MRAGAKTRLAKSLRRDATDAEKKLWRRLRDRELGDYKFRRQHPIGPYVVDFVCIEHRLVIEIDGGQHATQTAHDRARTKLLQEKGYRVLRFWNNEMLTNPDGILTVIEAALKAPHPDPLPQAGEGAE